MTAEQMAQDIIQTCQNAAGEIGHDAAQHPQHFPQYKEKLDEYRANGASRDVSGECLADSIYDDPGFLQDLAGDTMYGFVDRNAVLDILEKQGSAWRKAVKGLRR